ncbi:MAG: response regulator [Phycisphaerales bacterium]
MNTRSESASKAISTAASPIYGAAADPIVAQSHAIRVLCVDDHAVLIEGLKAQFAVSGGIEIVGSLPSATHLIEATHRYAPHVVLLDIELPGPDAFEMADRLCRAVPAVRIIVLSAHVRDSYISAAFTAGAAAYFSKADDLEHIVAGIREVMRHKAGSFLLGPKVQERCSPAPGAGGQGVHGNASSRRKADATGAPQTLLDTLTAREIEVLRMIGKGHSRNQIAEQLCRSVKTVDGHQARMMKKLGIEARADLMRLAIREGLASA